MTSTTLERLRAYYAGGATTTSFPRGGRLAVAAVICAVPAYFAFRLLFNTSGPGAMACVLGFVLFAGPAVIVLPALRHDREHAGREVIAQRRHEREVAAAVRAQSEAQSGPEPTTSTWESRPAPPIRW
jgi:hypothetical protein